MDEKKIEEAISRIQQMELLYEEVSAAIRKAPDKTALFSLQPAIQTLSAYLSDGDWQQDYELDEQHVLPAELKRGVLSQDGLYNLLCSVKAEEWLSE